MTGVHPALVARTIEDIDDRWLSRVFGRDVKVLDRNAIGTGQMSRTCRVSYTCDDVLATVVVKLAAEDASTRGAARAMAAYLREIEFFRSTAGGPERKVPVCISAAITDDGEWFSLVMEDVAAPAGDQLCGLAVSTAEAALQALAALQGATVADKALQAASWLNLPWPLTQAAYGGVLPGFLERFGGRLADEELAVVTWFGDHVDAWLADRRPPLGVVHGDLRSDNLLFPAADVLIVDWQSATWGPIMRDAAYFLGGSLLPDARRDSERDLVRRYVDTVVATGIDWSWDAAWDSYRHQALYGLLLHVVASMLVAPTERGDDMFATLVSRHAQHATDLDAASTVAGTHRD